jgi:hypothetical protein
MQWWRWADSGRSMIEWGTTACNPETDVGCVRSGSKSATFMKSEEGGVRHRDAMSDRIPQTTSYRTMGFESLAARHSQPIKMDQVFFAEREQK